MAGTIGFFTGSITSPHAKAFKVQAQTWQGNYSGLKKSIKQEAEENDPLISIAKSVGIDPAMAKMAKPLIENWIKSKASGALEGAAKEGPPLQHWG